MFSIDDVLSSENQEIALESFRRKHDGAGLVRWMDFCLLLKSYIARTCMPLSIIGSSFPSHGKRTAAKCTVQRAAATIRSARCRF